MGGCTSKQERKRVRSGKETSNDQKRRRRKPNEKEMDEREKEWRKERKKLREEVKRLRKKVKEIEEAKTTTATTEEEREYWKWVVEEMCVERAVRDEAVEKWKQLYLAIKNELDHLIIHTTSSSSGERKLKEEKEEAMEELRDEVRAKEETIEKLKERIALMDRQKYEKERDIDLLRQSLRILGSKKKNKNKKKTMNLLILKTNCV